MKMISRVFTLLLIIKQTFETGLGIDFGGKLHKGAMLLPRKYFTLVEDSISKTKTPS